MLNSHQPMEGPDKVIDYLEPKDDTKTDYADDLKMLEEIWIDRLQPFGEKGYNKLKIRK